MKDLKIIYKIHKNLSKLIKNEDHPINEKIKKIEKILESKKKKIKKFNKKNAIPRLKNRIKNEEMKEKAKYVFDGNIDTNTSRSAKYE